jgi:hypothetical protein
MYFGYKPRFLGLEDLRNLDYYIILEQLNGVIYNIYSNYIDFSINKDIILDYTMIRDIVYKAYNIAISYS